MNMSETQSCIIVLETTENIVTHTHGIAATINKSFESLIKAIVRQFENGKDDFTLQTVKYEAHDTNMFYFITLLQDFRNNGWSILSSNSYIDFSSQQLVKNFYLEKMVSTNEIPISHSPKKVSMSSIVENKEKEDTSACDILFLEKSLATSHSVPQQVASAITSPVRRLSQLGRDGKGHISKSEPENLVIKQNAVNSSSISTLAIVDKAILIPEPASKSKSLLEARRASLSEKQRSPSFTSEGLKILNDYSNKIAVELDRNEIMGTIVSNVAKTYNRPSPSPVPVAAESAALQSLPISYSSIDISKVDPIKPSKSETNQMVALSATSLLMQQQQQPLSPSPVSFNDLSPITDNNSSFSPAPVSLSNSSSITTSSSMSTPVTVSTSKASFTMTKSPVFSKLTPKFVKNNEENEEIKKKNENFFKKMVEDEEIEKRAKLEKEYRLDPEELAKLRIQEKEKEDHESMKAAHFKRLGAATVVSRGGALMSTGRGRGFSSAKR